MAPKRPREEGAADAGAPTASDYSRKPKKAKHGFRVGPENLPDGPWRRKVTKIKKDLITKAKVKKQYAKVKAEYQKQAATATVPEPTTAEPGQDGESSHQQSAAPVPEEVQIHPDRQAMLDSENQTPTQSAADADADADDQQQQQQQPRQPRQRHQKRLRRPDYFAKQLAAAEEAKKQAEERAAEAARREQERQKRMAERERYRKAMAKAKAPGRDGKRKIGRESKVLLERVQKLMGGN